MIIYEITYVKAKRRYKILKKFPYITLKNQSLIINEIKIQKSKTRLK